MKIISIFAIVDGSLYAVRYKNEDENEFKRIFDLWNDPEYLENFFFDNIKDLQNGFLGDISVEEAILRTRKYAKALESKLIEIAEKGKTSKFETLSTLFKPLMNYTIGNELLAKNKAYGVESKSWLRIYAIRVDTNIFVVSGGAIKLTQTMNERKHLIDELKKLEATRKYLQDTDNDDLEFLELF
jgi:hypothetical protein